MKNYIRYFLIILLSAALYGCDDLLEFEPQDETLEGDALKTAEDYQLLLNASYDVLKGSSGNYLGGRSQIMAELLADNLDGNINNSDYRSYFNRNSSYFNGSTAGYFGEPFITVYRANVLLTNIDNVLEISEETRNRIKGEAMFLRAISHFDLVRLFAQPYGYTEDNSHLGIPLRREPSQEVLERSTVKEVYDFILEDLQKAENLLPAENNGYATKWAAKGYLARVYFQMNDFENAYKYADDVIVNSGLTLDPDLEKRFSPEKSSESVFQLISTSNLDHRGQAFTSNYRSDLVNPPTLRASRELYNLATSDADDKRGQMWYKLQNEGTPDEQVYISKYNKMDYFNVPLLHLTELKLIRAESAAELNQNLSVAIGDLNEIRDRAYGVGNNTVSETATADEIIEIARLERRLELATEGNRVHDLKRIAVLENKNLKIRGALWSCPGMVIQFPYAELAGNPQFVPNEEGGCE